MIARGGRLQEMQINYELTKQDYIDFNLYHISYSKTSRQALFIQRYITSLIFLLAPFVVARFTEIPLEYWLVTFAITYLLWVFFYPKYFKRVVGKRVSKMVDEGKNVDLLGYRTVTIDAEGLHSKSDVSESTIKWSSVENVVETKEHIFIYVSAISAHIVPFRIFETDKDKEEFLKVLHDFVREQIA